MNQRRRTLAALVAIGALVAPTAANAAAELVAAWDFETAQSGGTEIKDIIGNKVGTISGSAVLTGAGGGRPSGGGKGFDVSAPNPGWLQYSIEAAGEGDANPLNKAAANDEMTVVLWQKNNSNVNSSSFWGHSAGSGSGNRGFQFHIPWSDGTIYFDTSGCCANPTQRLNANPANVLGEFDFTQWHHYAFVKKGNYKAIYIDGNLLIDQEGADPLPTDFERFSVGAANDATPPDAVIDDFGIYKGALTQAEIKAVMANGFVPPVDTDKDGIPDNYEKEVGLNPNDASDAKLDPDKDGCDNLCEYKAGTPHNDTEKPFVASVETTASFTTVVLSFNETLDAATAGNKANYTFSPALNIDTVAVKGKKVTLTTAKQTAGAAYDLSIKEIVDLSKNKIADNTVVKVYPFVVLKSGILKFAFFGGIGGTPVQGLYDDARYPNSPDWVAAATAFNSLTVIPDGPNENYGAIIEGILTVPANGAGDYEFFVRSDDASQLWVSTDTREANLSMVAEETGCCGGFEETGASETSAPITLRANGQYLIRFVYKEGGGGDWGQVAWRKVGSATPANQLQPMSGALFTAEAPGSPHGKILSQFPANGAKSAPGNRVEIVHLDGRTVQTTDGVALTIDGQKVAATFTKVGSVLTGTYTPNPELETGSSHTAVFEYKDAGGNATSAAWTFQVSPFDRNTLFVEAEDFDFGAGKTKGTAKEIGFDGPYVGGFFEGEGGEPDVDFFNPGGNAGQAYRPDTGVAAGKGPQGSAGLNRFYFQVEKNWTVGWNDPGDWQNYTRTFPTPAKKYNIYGHLSSGGSPIGGQIDRVTSGVGTATQTLEYVAQVTPKRATAGWDSLEVFQFTDKAGAPAVVEWGGKNTFRFTTLPGANLDIDWFAFVPVKATAATVSNLKAARGASGKVKLTFDGGGVIQKATAVGGPYTDTAIKSGDEVDAAGGTGYYRGKK